MGGNQSPSVGVSINYLADDFDLKAMIDGAMAAERLGFDSVWVHDAFLGRHTLAAWDPVSVLTAIAANTDDLEVCTGILQPHLRNPVSLAQDWATLHEIADGRSVFGVGSGAGKGRLVDRQYGSLAAFDGLEADSLYERRGTMFTESVDVIRQLWEQDKVSFDGEVYGFDDVTLGTARPADTPPILMAAGVYFPTEPGGPVHHAWSADRAGQYVLGPYERVGRLADGWLTAMPTPAEYSSSWEKMKAVLDREGKDPDGFIQALNCFVNVSPSIETSKGRIKDYLERFHGPPIHDDVVDRWGIAGPPDEIIDTLGAFIDRGVSRFQFVLASRDQFSHMERVAEEVLPSL